MIRLIACTLSVSFLLPTVLFVPSGRSTNTNTTAPTLDVPAEVKQGTDLVGSAADPDAPIEVTATYNGVTIGSDSTTESNNVNCFEFSTAGIPIGGVITVTATDDCGKQSISHVDVVRCPQTNP